MEENLQGYLYILSNKAMPGLLKIGYTTRTVQERIQELSSTGVPGKFEIQFYCLTEQIEVFEKKVHLKLSRYNYHKEFFRCSVEVAIIGAKDTLAENGYFPIETGGRSNKSYLTDNEKRQISLAEQGRKRKETEEENRKKEIQVKASNLAREFHCLFPYVEQSVNKHCSNGKNGGIKSLASFALAASVVGLFLIDEINPTHFDDGFKTAKKLSPQEIEKIKRLHVIVKSLKEINTFSREAQFISNSLRGNVRLISYNKNAFVHDISELAQGVFVGVGLPRLSPEERKL